MTGGPADPTGPGTQASRLASYLSSCPSTNRAWPPMCRGTPCRLCIEFAFGEPTTSPLNGVDDPEGPCGPEGPIGPVPPAAAKSSHSPLGRILLTPGSCAQVCVPAVTVKLMAVALFELQFPEPGWHR